MQTPVNSSPHATSSIYEDSRLIRLWRNWLIAAGSIPLDKWLKNNLRDLAGSASAAPNTMDRKSGHKNSVPQLPLSDQASLTGAMNNALRFQQLACGLELLYQADCRSEDYKTVNLLDWDLYWQPRDVQTLSPVIFWYWVQLRLADNQEKQNQAQLKDAQRRREFFQHLIERDYFVHPGATFLWLGLRPQWASLLEERKNNSDWSEEQQAKFLQLQTTNPPLWLRVHNELCAKTEDSLAGICTRLTTQGVDAVLDSESGIYLRGGTGINSTLEYKSGLVEIQDLASQLIAQAVDVKPGQKVWDTCAGAGGKTLAIAARMNNKGAIIATDLHGYKLEELKRRAKRADAFNVRTFIWDGDTPLRLPKEVAQQQGFDWVLIDAPCSSSGTWRRNPDARWRFDEADTQELIHLQQKILRNSAPAVRKGGNLVYATCSWQVSENEGQVAWFLQQHPQFELRYQRILGAPELDADTMFVAVLNHK